MTPLAWEFGIHVLAAIGLCAIAILVGSFLATLVERRRAARRES